MITDKKVVAAGKRTHKERSRSPSPSPLNVSFSGSNSSFPSFGRWTAHRAYVKKVIATTVLQID